MLPTLLAILSLATALIWLEQLRLTLAIQSILLLLGAIHILRGPISAARALAALSPAALGALQWAALSTADAARTWLATLHWLSLSAVFLIVCRELRHSASRKQALRWLAAGAAITSSLALVQFFTSQGRFYWIWPSPEPEVFSPFQNRNNFAAFVLLFLPLVLHQAVQRGQSAILWLAGASAMIAAVVASGSRAGSAILLAELIALAVLFRRELRPVLLPAAALIAIAIAVGGWEILSRKLEDPDPLRHRKDLWQSTLAMAASRPASGFGLGTFPAVYPAFARFDSGHYVNHAHNDWLEWAAEGGLPLLLFLAGFALWTVPKAVQSRWGLGLPAVFLHAFVDYPMQRLALAAWVAVVAAAVLAETASARHLPRQRQHPESRASQPLPVENIPPVQDQPVPHLLSQALPI